jgi:hypothetical protein
LVPGRDLADLGLGNLRPIELRSGGLETCLGAE